MSPQTLPKSDRHGIPNFRWINRNLPITDVAKALDLQFDQQGMIHCWHPSRHQHGDRTASVGVRKENNTVKCFGCDSRPIGPLDLVIDVLKLDSPLPAARWLADRFEIPTIPKGKHLQKPRANCYRFGLGEDPLNLLIQSGIWARLNAMSQRLAPVLLSLAESPEPDRSRRVSAAYATLRRHSGIGSETGIVKALNGLAEIGWLKRLTASPERSHTIVRETNAYLLTPFSEEVQELAHSVFAQTRVEIEAERELRRERRRRKQAGSIV